MQVHDMLRLGTYNALIGNTALYSAVDTGVCALVSTEQCRREPSQAYEAPCPVIESLLCGADFETSHQVFRNVMPDGFAWEVNALTVRHPFFATSALRAGCHAIDVMHLGLCVCRFWRHGLGRQR